MAVVATVYIDGIPLSSDAIVHIESHLALPTGAAKVRQMNPRQIEQIALARQEWGQQKTFTQLVLEIVAETLDAD